MAKLRQVRQRTEAAIRVCQFFFLESPPFNAMITSASPDVNFAGAQSLQPPQVVVCPQPSPTNKAVTASAKFP